MILYGNNSVHITTINDRNINCHNCGRAGSITFSVFRKHIHIFLMPIFPMGKNSISQCGYCQHTLEHKEMPDSLKKAYKNMEGVDKNPLWQFSGALLIVCLIVYGIYSNKKDNEKDVQYIESPTTGDIYEWKIEVGHYSSMKVVGVSTDSVFVSLNEYEIDKPSSIHKIDMEENYPEEIHSIARGDLIDMHNEGEILGVDRD